MEQETGKETETGIIRGFRGMDPFVCPQNFEATKTSSVKVSI